MNVYLRKYTNAHSRFLVIDHALVHYRDEGEGPAILLIHGSFSSLHTFDGWVERLKGEFRLIRLDLPGFGLSGTSEDHQYGIEKYIECITHFMDMLGIDQFSIAGSSLGGWLAWEYALVHPERLNKLILIDAAGFLDEKSIPLPFRMARTPFVNKIVRYVIKRNVIEVFLRQVYGHPDRVTSSLVDRYYDLFSREGNPEAFFALVNTKFKDNTHKLPRIETPCLILWGGADEWLPLANAYHFLDEMPNAELIIYEGVGHIPMEEEPEITAMDMRGFMLGLPIHSIHEHD